MITQELKPLIREPGSEEQLSVLGIPVSVKATATETGGAFSAFETEDPEGAGPPLHVHHNEAESLLVLSGRYLVQIEDKTQVLERGGFTFIPTRIPHTYKCVGPGPGRLLIVLTPGGYESFFRALDAAQKSGDVSPETLTRIGKEHGIEIVGPPIA